MSLASNTTQKRVTTSLKSRIIVANERDTNANLNNLATKDPISKYTKAKMPNVYYSHPTAALDFIDVNQVGDWENLPDGKLLAHPSGHEVRNLDMHQGIKANLFAAIIDITQSETVGICSPRPSPTAMGMPIIFLIYNISELHRQMLLKRKVWSSTPFTFRVTTLDPVSPDYLFGITHLTIKSDTEVKKLVRKVWDSQTSVAFLENIITGTPSEQRPQIKNDIDNFSKSMRVELLDTRKHGGAYAPTFNVLADGKLINDDDTWCRLRTFFTAQSYAPQFQDPGLTGADLHRCSICQGIDHPRGLCKFPKVEGWNGPF